MKLTIKEIKVYRNKSDGTPLVTKSGDAFKNVMIVAEEEVLGTVGSKIYVNDFSNATNSWQAGSVIDMDVEWEERGGKYYLKGKLPKNRTSSSISREEYDNLKMLAEQAFNLANSAHKRIDEMTKERTFPTGEEVARSYADEKILLPEDIPFN